MNGNALNSANANGCDKVFVARQPIFDSEQKLFGYELLYRGSDKNSYDETDGTSATMAVVQRAFLTLGAQLTGKSKAFINFNQELLKNKVPLQLCPETTVVEILEDVTVDSTLIEVCQELKRAGYIITLDDFDPVNEGTKALVDLADIIKVDFRQSSASARVDIVKSHRGKNIDFLAEKVETLAEFFEARKIGYHYFQGYFFGEPQIMSAKHIPINKVNCLRMLHEINRPDMDFRGLEDIVKRDAYLTYTLLNYINSAYFGLRNPVGSIMQALSFLGEKELRRWSSLVLMTFMGSDKPSEVSMTSLIRAKFCECLAKRTDIAQKASELFMTGMFSMLDVLVGRPLNEILEKINVCDDIKVALSTGANRHGDIIQLVFAYEKGMWDDVDILANKLSLDSPDIAADYHQSVEWAEQVFDMGTVKAA